MSCVDTADGNHDLQIGAPGDTGSCIPAASAFADNGDGTVTDERSGLVWEKLADDDSIHDWDASFTWSEASSVKLAQLNAGGGFAGHTDWRVPTIEELISLIRQGHNPPVAPEFDSGCAPGCSVTSCSCTHADFHWSASTDPRHSNAAWSVIFGGDGVAEADLKTYKMYVRAVRGGS